MTWTLKQFQHHASLSEETTAFTAKVAFGGTVVGWAKNDGQGGSTIVHLTHGITPSQRAAAEEMVAASWMAEYVDEAASDATFMEAVVDVLVDAALTEKEAKRVERGVQREAKKNAARGFPFTFRRDVPEGVQTIGLRHGTPEAVEAMAQRTQTLASDWTLITPTGA